MLPDGLRVKHFQGIGRRLICYKGDYEGKDVAIKVYRKEFVKKYQRKCNVGIAEFEYEPNMTLYNIDKIRPHIAKPYRIFVRNSGFTYSFVQEYIDGITLGQLIAEQGHLPEEILQAGYTIVRLAEASGVHDMDIFPANVLVTQKKGTWVLKLHDFNMLPQHINPPNPFVALGIKIGLHKKSCRDYRNLRNWQRVGK